MCFAQESTTLIYAVAVSLYDIMVMLVVSMYIHGGIYQLNIYMYVQINNFSRGGPIYAW